MEHLAIVQWMVAPGVDINKVDDRGQTVVSTVIHSFNGNGALLEANPLEALRLAKLKNSIKGILFLGAGLAPNLSRQFFNRIHDLLDNIIPVGTEILYPYQNR